MLNTEKKALNIISVIKSLSGGKVKNVEEFKQMEEKAKKYIWCQLTNKRCLFVPPA